MTFLLGSLAAGLVSGLMLLCGYAVTGLLSHETRLNRFALASVLGLAWVVFFASAVGTFAPLTGAAAWLTWTPAALTLLGARQRRQLIADISAGLKSPGCSGTIVGILGLWIALLLPFLAHPDIALFDGKTNHDNFFWCVGADYLQRHDYLVIPGTNPDRPLYNLVWSFCGWHPVWARMGAEGFVAIGSATVGLTPVRLYNFLASALLIPWIFVALALARTLGAPRLNRVALAFVGFCQPVFFFFVANGNLPNLLGALFSGGIWLATLLLAQRQSSMWTLGGAAMLFVHGILASYPEIFLFGLAPVGLLALHQMLFAQDRSRLIFVWGAAVVAAGFVLNPATTVRLWSGIQNSIVQAHNDAAWANIFDRITFAGYLPGLITLGVPSVRLYGIIGGIFASLAVLGASFLVFKNSRQRLLLLFSLSGFFALLIYTVATSFGYGWQKSVQFSGVHFAVLFPVLAAGTIQHYWQQSPRRFLPLSILFALFGLLFHSVVGITAENFKSATTKKLTDSALALHYEVEKDLPNRIVLVDASTFSAAFFQGMWSAKIFPNNPLIFLQHEDRSDGGYLSESVKTITPAQALPDAVYYLARDWAEAFDYDERPVLGDEMGVLLSRHNLVTARSGFYRAAGVPQMAKPEFSLTLQPFAEGWVEFVLEPKAPVTGCELQATVLSHGATLAVAAKQNGNRLVARFPLRGNTPNTITARITGAPATESGSEESDYPFQIISIKSGRTP